MRFRIIGVLCLLFAAGSAAAIWICLTRTAQNTWLAHAVEQVEIFEQMRQQAIAAEPRGAVDCLDYVANYYPSGSKHATGSRLDRIAELARASAIREIIATLRSKTGKDLGEDPVAWIAMYGEN